MNAQPHPGGEAWEPRQEPGFDDMIHPASSGDDAMAFGAGLGSETASSDASERTAAPRKSKSSRAKSKTRSTKAAKTPRRKRSATRAEAEEPSSAEAAAGATSEVAEIQEAAETAPARRKRPARKRKAKAAPSVAVESQEASTDDGEAVESAGSAGSSSKKKRTRRKRRSSKAEAEGSVDSAAEAADEPPVTFAAEEPSGEEGETDSKRSKVTRKRKRTRRRTPDTEDALEARPDSEEAAATEPADEQDAEAPREGSTSRKRRRGSRGGRRNKRSREGAAIEVIPGEDDDLPLLPGNAEPDPEEEGDGRGRSKKKRSRRKKGRDAEGDEGAESEGSRSKKSSRKRRKSASAEEEAEPEEEGRGRRKKKKRGRGKKAEAEATEVEVKRDQVILVNAVDVEEKRVAVVDNGQIIDFLMNSESSKTLVNDIYRGKVVNLEPAIGAAFVDFGQGRNGFLHTSDVLGIYGEEGFTLDKLLTTQADPDEWDEDADADEIDEEEGEEASGKEAKGKGPRGRKSKGKGKGRGQKGRSDSNRRRQRLPITDLVNNGDLVVAQVTKDAIGDKGPTLTTYISIPGRYLVLMPSMARTGVSRKIPDDKERRRLKRILASLDVPSNMGVIVRTAGVGKTKTDLKRDLEYLLGVWETFGKRLTHGRGPVPLYQESELSIRTLRDLFGPRTEAVIVDDPMVYDQLIEFAERLMPEHVQRIKLHEGDRPLFHTHGIEQDFERIFARRVDLPSGGSIVFDQTEALVAIDVNSGRTRSDGFDFEEIALKTNLEAVPEIARQIRLRDLGGIIVCDFIDMMRSASMRAVEKALRNELATDRARSKLGRISQFGLLEMTRQRLGPGTHKKVFQACPRCRGTARIRTVPSRAAAILRRLGSAVTQKGFTQVEVRAHPEVVEYLQDELSDYTRALEHRSEKQLKFTAVPEQPEDSVLRYLRADGREVRPGGRRKR